MTSFLFWTGWAVGILTCVLIATVRATFVRRRSRLPLASRVLRDTNRWSTLRRHWLSGCYSARRELPSRSLSERMVPPS